MEDAFDEGRPWLGISLGTARNLTLIRGDQEAAAAPKLRMRETQRVYSGRKERASSQEEPRR